LSSAALLVAQLGNSDGDDVGDELVMRPVTRSAWSFRLGGLKCLASVMATSRHSGRQSMLLRLVEDSGLIK
jgi:hypothetical protein